VFTINNPENDKLPEDWYDQEWFTFVVWQVEIGENGTRHLQGYLVVSRPVTLQWLKRHASSVAHWEPRMGTHEQAVGYCTKSESRVDGPWSHGNPPAQGKRSDLLNVKARIDEGASERELAEEHFSSWVRYHRSFREYRRVSSGLRSAKTHVTVIWGPTGTGKSRHCMGKHPLAYWKPTGKWWDGYDGVSPIVIDEFYGWLPYDLFLRLLDRYPLTLEHKGGSTNMNSKHIIITSNKHPYEWYDPVKCPWPPLARRIDELYYLGYDGVFIREDPIITYENTADVLAAQAMSGLDSNAVQN
jgi:hypothetical protein